MLIIVIAIAINALKIITISIIVIVETSIVAANVNINNRINKNKSMIDNNKKINRMLITIRVAMMMGSILQIGRELRTWFRGKFRLSEQ